MQAGLWVFNTVVFQSYKPPHALHSFSWFREKQLQKFWRISQASQSEPKDHIVPQGIAFLRFQQPSFLHLSREEVERRQNLIMEIKSYVMPNPQSMLDTQVILQSPQNKAASDTNRSRLIPEGAHLKIPSSIKVIICKMTALHVAVN